MNAGRKIEIFTAGCPVCEEAVDGRLAGCCAGRGPDPDLKINLCIA